MFSVLAVLSMWLEDYGLLEDDPDIAPQLKDFLDLVISPPSLAFSAKLILQSLNKLVRKCSSYSSFNGRSYNMKCNSDRNGPSISTAPTTPADAHQTEQTLSCSKER